MSYQRYLALGDSISIDLYPALDRARTAATRQLMDLQRGFGAASLFYANNANEYPEFSHRDLASQPSTVIFRNHHHFSYPNEYPTDNLTVDGATTTDVLQRQLPHVEPSGEATLATLTTGGNDLLQAMRRASAPTDLVAAIVGRLRRILSELRERCPRATVLLGTVYDPSDGTNDLGGGRLDREAAWLAEYNAAVRQLAESEDFIILADIHRHFLGHGITVPQEQRWYWSGLIFEPNARGASEVRRVWVEALGM